MKPENVLPPDDADPAISALLAALRQARPHAVAPDADFLARWLDGTATPGEVAAVETALCDDPELRRAVLALRGAAQAPERVPEGELCALESLVPPTDSTQREHNDTANNATLAPVLAFPRRRGLELVACAAAVVLVAWPAWKLGEHFARDRERAEQRELARLLGGNPLGGGTR